MKGMSLIVAGITFGVAAYAPYAASLAPGKLRVDIHTNAPAGNPWNRVAEAVHDVMTASDSAVILSGIPSGSTQISTPAPPAISLSIR